MEVTSTSVTRPSDTDPYSSKAYNNMKTNAFTKFFEENEKNMYYWCNAVRFPRKLTAEMCLETVKYYGNALEYVPEKLKTYELCLEAVKQDGDALEYVPENLKDIIIKKLKT